MEYNEYDKIDVIIDEMEKNKIDDIYYEEINHHFFDTFITFEEFYDTYVERIYENAISVNENDVSKAIEYIKKGIVCCAAEVGGYLLGGNMNPTYQWISEL